jgi:hypothetical protein
MIPSLDTEKAFDKINTLHDKSFEETRSRRKVPQHNKSRV